MTRADARTYAATGQVAENGRTRLTITCPWCGTETVAHVWSLAGSGKRCPAAGCDAVHVWRDRQSIIRPRQTRADGAAR